MGTFVIVDPTAQLKHEKIYGTCSLKIEESKGDICYSGPHSTVKYKNNIVHVAL